MARRVALTTIDNPFDPLTQFDKWYAYDERNGYHSTSLLARISKSVDDLSEADENAVIEESIDEICRYNLSGVHKKIVRDG